MFLGPEHRFLPLNIDWNPKSFSEGKDWNPKSFSEGKCQQKLKLNFEKKNNSLQMYLKMNKTQQFKENHSEKIAKNLNLTVFTDWHPVKTDTSQ